MQHLVLLAVLLAAAATSIAIVVLRRRADGGRGPAGGDIRFRPREPVNPQQLFGLLLSGNLFVMNDDDFNQLGSRLGKAQVGRMLEHWWRVRSADDLQQALARVTEQLAEPPAAYAQALAARREGRRIDTPEALSLQAVEQYLVVEGVLPADGATPGQLGTAAWNLQRAAALVRWGFTMGHLDAPSAWALLDGLAERARREYASWHDYSLAYLLVRGVWSPVEPAAPDEAWQAAARSHRTLLGAHDLLQHAAAW